MKNNITIEELTILCHQYDLDIGDYPEHEYEGRAVLRYILKKLKE